jgi:hypothetical protein
MFRQTAILTAPRRPAGSGAFTFGAITQCECQGCDVGCVRTGTTRHVNDAGSFRRKRSRRVLPIAPRVMYPHRIGSWQ